MRGRSERCWEAVRGRLAGRTWGLVGKERGSKVEVVVSSWDLIVLLTSAE